MQPLGQAVDLADRPTVAHAAAFHTFRCHFGAAFGSSQQGGIGSNKAGLPCINPRSLGYGDLFQPAQYRSKTQGGQGGLRLEARGGHIVAAQVQHQAGGKARVLLAVGFVHLLPQ